MCGHFSEGNSLSRFAREEARRVQFNIATETTEGQQFGVALLKSRLINVLKALLNDLVARLGAEFVHLTLLSLLMAVTSFAMDIVIAEIQRGMYSFVANMKQFICYFKKNGKLVKILVVAKHHLVDLMSFSLPAYFSAWVLYPLVCVCFATAFVRLVGPNAIGM